MDKRTLAETLYTQLEQDGLTVAIYPSKVKAASEFRRQAAQFAADHQAIGLENGNLALGVPMPLSYKSVPEMLNALSLALQQLFEAFPDITNYTSIPLPVKHLAIFTHGEKDQLQAAKIKTKTDGTEENQWIKTSLGAWAKGLAPYLSPNAKVLLYACSTAGIPSNGGAPFAELLRRTLRDELAALYGESGVTVEVWGHRDAGHTTANSRLIQFYGGAICDAGTDLLETHSDWLTYFLLEENRLPQNGTSSKHTRAADLCGKAIRRVYSGRNHEGHNDPLNTYIREIPFIGIDRVWTDVVSANPGTYLDLALTADTSHRLNQGLTILRERFSAEWQTLRNTTL